MKSKEESVHSTDFVLCAKGSGPPQLSTVSGGAQRAIRSTRTKTCFKGFRQVMPRIVSRADDSLGKGVDSRNIIRNKASADQTLL